ncbi:diphenol oxidase-A2 [Daedaleopsis nitida]|nr:diphenol oxidase-A2 [Daedaleopsis nitida]
MPDVEMTPAEDKKEEKKPVLLTLVAEIKATVVLIERAVHVSTLEPRFTHRVLRSLTHLGRKLDDKILRDAIQAIYITDSSTKKSLLSWLPEAYAEQSMDIDVASTPSTQSQSEPLPEVDIYFRLLILHHLLTLPANYPKATKLAHETVEKMQALNRRSMDRIAAKIWSAVERTKPCRCSPVLLFLAAQRTAALRHDDETEASLVNRILRSYLQYSLYDQADKLVSKTSFHARYHYYLGRSKAVQLNYTAAHTNLQQAIRRAPPAKTAPGFYQAVHKLSIVVELLMGDIPERSLFRHPVLEKALAGYSEIVKAVRNGSLSQTQSTLSRYAAQFESDKTYTLIVRLRQNVIKAGIRRLSLSYSRISLRDICVKLHLDSEEDAEYIVGKAIRGGVIEGCIMHEKGWTECGGQKSGYGPEVSDVFSRCISCCLELHNQRVKWAMQYLLNAHRKELTAAEGARSRGKELAKDIQEGGDMDEDGPDLGVGF